MPTFDVHIIRRYVREFRSPDTEADTEDDAITEAYEAILEDGAIAPLEADLVVVHQGGAPRQFPIDQGPLPFRAFPKQQPAGMLPSGAGESSSRAGFLEEFLEVPLEFVRKMAVRFGEIDPAGVVYYPNFFHYYHVAFEEFFGACHGLPYPQWMNERRIGFPTVHVVGDFQAPLFYGDVARIEVTVPRIGGKSVDFRYRVRTRTAST